MDKQEMRKQLTDLSFTEKVKLLERLRDRSLALAASGVEMAFDYPGDDDGDRVLAWFRELLRSIGTCLSTGHPEATLALVYSGIEVLGWLGAPRNGLAAGAAYRNWCNKYLIDRVQSVEGLVLTGDDLWAARCGFLHTSTPVSRLSRRGRAYQLWYQYQGKAGVNLIEDSRLPSLGLDIEKFALAFRQAGIAFIQDLNTDQEARSIAECRAQNFLRWGVAHVGKTATLEQE